MAGAEDTSGTTNNHIVPVTVAMVMVLSVALYVVIRAIKTFVHDIPNGERAFAEDCILGKCM